MYIYQADVYCDECGDDIKRQHDFGYNFDDSKYDSDQYPIFHHAEFNESDNPQNCSGCHVPLENPLTEDGVKFVLSTIADKLSWILNTDNPDIFIKHKCVLTDCYYKDSYHIEIVRDWTKQVKDYIYDGLQTDLIDMFLELTEGY